MKTIIFAVFMALANLAQADEVSYADKSKAVAESLLKSRVQNPGALSIESATVYSRPGPFGNVCGVMRGLNLFGVEARAYFVVSHDSPVPVYIGPMPTTSFKKSCSGNEVK